jgi:hypothetical protein
VVQFDSVVYGFINLLGVFKEAPLLNFFVAEEFFEELVILQLEEAIKGGNLTIFFSHEVVEESLVEEYFAFEMYW